MVRNVIANLERVPAGAPAPSLISIDHVEVEGCRPGRGHIPGELIEYAVEDYLSGRDPFVARALALLD